MNFLRRLSRIAAAALIGGSTVLIAGAASCGEIDSVEFVRALYHKQAQAQVANLPPTESEFFSLFSEKTRGLMRAPRSYPANTPAGPILNAFFGWGVLPRTEVGIGNVRRIAGSDRGPATVEVELLHHGGTHKAFVNVVREGSNWRIDDIAYDSGVSLTAHYRRVTRP